MATAPIYQSFAVLSGTQQQLEFTVTDNDGTAVDLTGGSARFVMARSQHSSTLAIDSDASPATATVTITDAANGLANAVITDENMDGLDGDYYWELQFTDSSGRAATVARGWMSIEANLV